ncbi:MAG TPA: hypothetical protein VMF91_18515 [Bryobacteraceae bacterium]|nr:hypothetical protein [Bryobacteraceae bacterium]
MTEVSAPRSFEDVVQSLIHSNRASQLEGGRLKVDSAGLADLTTAAKGAQRIELLGEEGNHVVVRFSSRRFEAFAQDGGRVTSAPHSHVMVQLD